MKRKLDKNEETLTKTGIKRIEEELALNKKALEMSQEHKNFLQVKRSYEDKMRPFTRENEDKELNNTIKSYEENIKIAEDKLKVLNDQLKNGVEVKEPKAPVGV